MKAITFFVCFLPLSSCFIEEKFNRSAASVDFHNETNKKTISDYERGC